VLKIFEKHVPLKNTQAKYGAISPDEASTEQVKHASMEPILELVISENIMEKLFLWSLWHEFTDETKIEQLKMYEMFVTPSHQPLLHHKPILKPLMMLLSSCSGTTTPTVETELVVHLNKLCSIIAKDPSILELFFHTKNSLVANHIADNTYFCPVAHPLICNQLVNYIYNGFLLPVMAPALHK
ncbi:hypothetical protein IHE44_0013164, partial [Lamprotornis superbus]